MFFPNRGCLNLMSIYQYLQRNAIVFASSSQRDTYETIYYTVKIPNRSDPWSVLWIRNQFIEIQPETRTGSDPTVFPDSVIDWLNDNIWFTYYHVILDTLNDNDVHNGVDDCYILGDHARWPWCLDGGLEERNFCDVDDKLELFGDKMIPSKLYIILTVHSFKGMHSEHVHFFPETKPCFKTRAFVIVPPGLWIYITKCDIV